jgi:sigma-E factor negative regulatory protein RseB
MKKLILLFCLVGFVGSAYSAEQVYFKIAVNENEYSTFLTDRISTQKETLQLLAAKMRQELFHPDHLNHDYYHVHISSGIKYFDRSVVQYDIVPIYGDRFRHLVMVDEKNGYVVRKEVYDDNNKLVFSFTSLDETGEEMPPQVSGAAASEPMHEFYNGFYLIADRELKDGTKHIILSDGINKFSVFRKKVSSFEPVKQERVLYGNYIFRKIVGKELYTAVGTLPFKDMEHFIDKIATPEESKK